MHDIEFLQGVLIWV